MSKVCSSKQGIFRLTAFIAVCTAVSSPAFAVCSTANQYNFSFATPAAATLNYANTYNYTANSTALGNQNFSVNFVRNNLTIATAGGAAMPALSNLITDGVAVRNLVVGGTFGARSNAAFTTGYVDTVFTFATPIRDFSVRVNDVDFTTNQFRDWLQVTGANGAATYTPSLTTPFGTNNTVPGPHTIATSSMVVGAAAAPVAVTVSQAAGTGASGNNATTGTIDAVFAQPVTSVTVRWGNYPLQTGETLTGQQAIGIQQVSFCPMPQLTVAKTSAPVVSLITDPNRFNIPGSDTYYTLTVTNSDSSPVDLNAALLTDVLPAAMTFSNADIDGAGPLTGNFEFIPGTSGLTLTAANITYSNNAGATYAYTPVAGYDAAMTALRINPQGSMAANSSFSVRFRTRIK
jgi:uncharacterized repeat protein (TIGR01451 family)